MTGVHRFNERKTSTLVSILVSIPFTFITVLVRLSALSVIIAFMPQKYTLFLLLGIFSSLLVLNMIFTDYKDMCPRQNPHGDVGTMLDCCVDKKCSHLFGYLPRLMLKAVADILVPLGYNNDTQLGHNPSRGSWLILTNYMIMMTGLGLGLWYSILHHVPNTYHGLNMAKNGLKVEIPDTNLILRTEYGMDIKVCYIFVSMLLI